MPTAEEIRSAVEKVRPIFETEPLAMSAVASTDPKLVAETLGRIHSLHPRVILEIGTHYGLTAALMAPLCEKVVTVDINCQPKARRVLDLFGATNVVQVITPNDALKRAFIADLAFDFAFIDGDHSFEGVSLDFGICHRCGRVLFHDYWSAFPGVVQLVDGLRDGAVLCESPFAWWFAASLACQESRK